MGAYCGPRLAIEACFDGEIAVVEGQGRPTRHDAPHNGL